MKNWIIMDLYVFIFLISLFFKSGCGFNVLTQIQLDNITRDCEIKAEVVDNLKDSTKSHAIRIHLHNTGNELVPRTGWKLFFHSLYLLLPKVFPKATSSILEIEKVKVTMYGGDLYSLEPTTMFREIKHNETRVIEIEAALWSVSETDFMPNWYFVSTTPGVSPRIASSTASLELQYVEPFDDIRQWKRYTYDRYNPFTPQNRMKRLQVHDTGRIDKAVIPTPLHMNITDVGQTISIDSSWTIYKGTGDVDKVADYTHSTLGLQFSNIASTKTIRLSVDQPQVTSEAYDIHIDPADQFIAIDGKSEAGLFYGVQSLLSLMKSYPTGMPKIEITDEPRFEHRGMHVDVARNFHSVEDLKRLMDALTMYKMNKLHLHLSDDEGWRLEIPDLPELTTIGANRCHDVLERSCIIPQYGSGPFQNSSGTGFYSIDDYKDLLRYADERFIEVIPEFDMPGHAHAAIKSMEVRFNTTSTEEFRLIDPDDTSFYISVQQWMDNAINPCIESTYNFIAKIMDTAVDLHKDIQPLKVYHFGGDEVAKGAWENSSRCEEFLTNNPKYNISKGLKMYFVERVANLTATRGLEMRGWEDGFMDGDGIPFSLDHFSNKNVSANPWDNIWEWGASQRAYKFANAGYKVIMSQGTDLYFDHPYEPDPKERGLYWATRYTDTRKTFGFLPDSLYDNIDVKRSGRPLTKADVCGEDMAKCDLLLKPENVIGIQGQLWSETVRTSENFDSMIFPRLLALAERAWHKADFEEKGISDEERKRRETTDWTKFANTLGKKELGRLDELGILYRVPPPGARVTNGKVEFSVTFPGLSVQYSADGGDTWLDVTRNNELTWTWNATKILHLRTKSGSRYSRVVKLIKGESLPWTDQDTIDYIGTHIHLSAGVVDNLNKDDNYVKMTLKLKNNGNSAVQKGTWKLYFFNLYGVAEETLDCGLTSVHVNGDLYYFTPSMSMVDLKPGAEMSCTWHQKWWNIAKTDFFPNWYVWSEGMEPKVIANTNETLDYVLPYDSPNKWKKVGESRYNPYTTTERYEMYKFPEMEIIHTLLPTPQEIVYTATKKQSLEGWVVVRSTEFPNEAQYLAGTLKLQTVSVTPAQNFIHFVKSNYAEHSTEGYKLNIKRKNITIEAGDPAGAFYASQSLISLHETGNGMVQPLDIIDKPRFKYRGIMIDTARNFKPKEWLFKILDAMAMYKLNTLHLHLTDDEAWRLEIPAFPELTQLGANRCQNQDRDLCLIPQRGSGPDKSAPGSGYYTVQDYRDILQHAKSRHITIIPEIDMPGHSRAAVASMEYRATLKAELDSRGADTNNMTIYHLSDAATDTDIKTIQNWKGSALNPCMNSTYEFIGKLLDEMISIHRGIQDLKTFHVGGDEVAEGSWKDSQACKDLYGDFNTTFLKRQFMKRVGELVASRNLDMSAWEDGVYGDDVPNPRGDFDSRDVFAYAWNNVWEDGFGKRSAQFADAGYKVILAMVTHLYLDFPYEPDPEEMGLYWGTRYVNTQKIFGFMPNDIFANAEFNKLGEPINLEDLCEKFSCPKTVNTSNVVGMQGSMFSDLIRTEENVHYSLFPKILALAERAWHKAVWEDDSDKSKREKAKKEDWNKFRAFLGHQELPRLEKSNLAYRVPPPGAIIDGDKLIVNTMYPNHDVEISTDGGKMWSLVKDNTYLPRRKFDIHLRAVSKLKKYKSRPVSIKRDDITSGQTTYTIELYLHVFVCLNVLFYVNNH